MANVKISELPVATSVTGSEITPIVQGGVTKSVPISKLAGIGLLTGYSVGSNTAIAATDSVLAAFAKAQGQIDARLTDAPNNSNQYARQGGAWVVVTGGGGSSTLAGLTDVNVSSLFHGYRLIYDTATSKWISQSPYTVSSTASSPRPLVVADANALINLQNATSSTVTIPLNSTQAIPVGVPITLRQDSAGPISLSPAGGVTISTGSLTATVARGDVLVLVKRAADTWDTFYQAATVGEPLITAGTSAQYIRGNKTLGTFSTDVRNAVLSGYSVGSNTALANSDSVEAAFGKVQGQLNAKAPIASPSFTGRALFGGAVDNGADILQVSGSGKFTGDVSIGMSTTSLPGNGNTDIGVFIDAGFSSYFSRTGSAVAYFNVNTPSGATGIARFHVDGFPVAQVDPDGSYKVGTTKVIGAQDTGWTAFGSAVTANKGTYNPAASYTISTSYSQSEVQALATALVAANARIKALEAALRTHGLIN